MPQCFSEKLLERWLVRERDGRGPITLLYHECIYNLNIDPIFFAFRAVKITLQWIVNPCGLLTKIYTILYSVSDKKNLAHNLPIYVDIPNA